MAKHRQIHLTVRNDFAGFRKGDHIEDEADVNRILASEHRHHVVRVAADNGPEAPAEAAPIAEPASDTEAPAKNGRK